MRHPGSGTLRMFAKELENDIWLSWHRDVEDVATVTDDHIMIHGGTIYVGTIRNRIKFFNDLADELDKKETEMSAQSRLIKSIEEKIKFAPNDGGSEIPQHTETARQIAKMVLEYVHDDLCFEAAMKDAITRAIEEIGT